ncbi:fumarylacetoacetate hydrolase, partial [Cutaneotrichosporon oleaginosum]
QPWRRLIRFKTPDGRELFGEPVDEALDVGLAVAKGLAVVAHVIVASCAWDPTAARTGEKAVVAQLLAPISPSECGTIRATGLNYTDHARELNMPIPKVPELFFKPGECLADPGETIPVPPCAQNNELDYEVELAIIISRPCRNVRAAEATQYVLGWTCANDLTARELQKQASQWGFSKGFDKFCPLGPVLVSAAALPDPREVTLQTRVNGQLVQSGSAANMIWHVSEIVAYLSQGTTLPAGTVIITGTPPGIGASRGSWLRDGDEVRCTISHGIGESRDKMEPST